MERKRRRKSVITARTNFDICDLCGDFVGTEDEHACMHCMLQCDVCSFSTTDAERFEKHEQNHRDDKTDMGPRYDTPVVYKRYLTDSEFGNYFLVTSSVGHQPEVMNAVAQVVGETGAYAAAIHRDLDPMLNETCHLVCLLYVKQRARTKSIRKKVFEHSCVRLQDLHFSAVLAKKSGDVLTILKNQYHFNKLTKDSARNFASLQ